MLICIYPVLGPEESQAKGLALGPMGAVQSTLLMGVQATAQMAVLTFLTFFGVALGFIAISWVTDPTKARDDIAKMVRLFKRVRDAGTGFLYKSTLLFSQGLAYLGLSGASRKVASLSTKYRVAAVRREVALTLLEFEKGRPATLAEKTKAWTGKLDLPSRGSTFSRAVQLAFKPLDARTLDVGVDVPVCDLDTHGNCGHFIFRSLIPPADRTLESTMLDAVGFPTDHQGRHLRISPLSGGFKRFAERWHTPSIPRSHTAAYERFREVLFMLPRDENNPDPSLV